MTNKNELYKTLYHIKDTINHKIKIEELFIKYINNILSEDLNNLDEKSIISLIIKKDIIKSNDDLVNKILLNTMIISTYSSTNFNTDISDNILCNTILNISKRIIEHDNSKLCSKSEYDIYKNTVYKFQNLDFGTEEYNKVKEEVGKGFEIHYMNNMHHIEHFTNGIYGMNLYNILEMILDWCSSAVSRGFKFKLSSIYRRIESDNFSKGLCDIIKDNIYLILDKDQIIDDRK